MNVDLPEYINDNELYRDEWCLIIKSYYPIQIENLIRKMSVEFEFKNWWIESSGTSSMTSETENVTKLTLSLVPKFELD